MKLLVVGGGPAGVTPALQARELGADVTLLEAEQIGRTNLNRGPGRSVPWPGLPGRPGTDPHGSVSAWKPPRR